MERGLRKIELAPEQEQRIIEELSRRGVKPIPLPDFVEECDDHTYEPVETMMCVHCGDIVDEDDMDLYCDGKRGE